MRHLLGSRLAGSAAALLFIFSHAHAQPQEITAQEADAYFRQIQQEAIDIMRRQDFDRLDQWVEQNIADGAVFQVSLNILANGARKGFAEFSLEKDDMRRLQGVLAEVFRQQAIDYSLDVIVTDVVAHGPGAATTRVRWTERLSVAPEGASGTAQQGQERPRLTMEAVADCNHLLQRGEGQLMIGLSTCTAELRL